MNENDMKNANIKKGYTTGDILTAEDKSNYRNFAQKIHKIGNKELFMLNADVADNLTSDEKDIVAYEIRLRESDVLAKQHIDSMNDYTVEKTHKDVSIDPTQVSSKYVYEERHRTQEMNDDLLEKSKNIINNTYIPLTQDDMKTAKSKGINMAWKKYLIMDDNGDEIRVNAEEIQERFRRKYLKTLSENTGIDYTRLDKNFDSRNDDIEYAVDGNAESISSKKTQSFGTDTEAGYIDPSDYEDD